MRKPSVRRPALFFLLLLSGLALFAAISIARVAKPGNLSPDERSSLNGLPLFYFPAAAPDPELSSFAIPDSETSTTLFGGEAIKPPEAPASMSTNPSKPLVILITGDGGWAPLVRHISDRFSAEGYPVVALNALHYFWRRRTPDELTADVERIIDRFARPGQPLIFLGYSRGAGVFPFVIHRLPPSIVARIQVVVLLGPPARISFDIHWFDYIGQYTPSDSLPLAPEVKAINDRSILCVCGEGEVDSLCDEMLSEGATMVILPGGHHFGRDYDAVADTILNAIAADEKMLKER